MIKSLLAFSSEVSKVTFCVQIRHVSEAVVQSIADIRDEISDDRISVRTEIKQVFSKRIVTL